ncbi:MAG: SPOR domain-containing protein [Gammaproteobacteria bacterium]|nr:SPOR domain-containing protein [Gammaproteobacteria bacterium]
MARDYAKRTTTRKPPPKPLPGWLWLLGGLLVGLFIAFLVYLQQQGGSPFKGTTKPGPAATDTRAVTKPVIPKAPMTPPKREGINFDFYSILPEQEVVIPESELAKGRTIQEKANYYLQVGSFKSNEDAQARMAELFLLNLNPTIQKVTIDGGNSWHRVRVGPYTDQRKLDQARRRLQDNGIDFFVVKERQG